MSLHRNILRSLRRSSSSLSTTTTTQTQTQTQTQTLAHHHHYIDHDHLQLLNSLPAHSCARRPNRSRIEHDPNSAWRLLPESISALCGSRLDLHNRVHSLLLHGDLDSASVLARAAAFSPVRPTVFTCNSIIAAMSRHNRHLDAIVLFQFFFSRNNISPNIASYNLLINAHCKLSFGGVNLGLEWYDHILTNAPFSPNSITYRHLTKALVEVNRMREAIDLFLEMLHNVHEFDSVVYSNMIRGFLENNVNLNKANELFDDLKQHCPVNDGVVNATVTFMDWFFKKGREKEAMESYNSLLLDPEIKMVPTTCNVLIEVFLKHGKRAEAWALFENLLDNHTPAFEGVNSDTFNLMVNDTFKLGKFTEAIDVFRKVGKKAGSKPFAMDVAGYKNIIMRYCENGMIDDAGNMFVELTSKSLSPDVTTYWTLIDAYFKATRVDSALEMYTKMVEDGWRVIPDYANRWFDILVENGKIVESAKILTKMGENGQKPYVKSYDVVIRGLCKEGDLDMSLDLINQMVRYSVALTPEMQEFVYEAFGKEGRRDEIEKLLADYAPYWHPSWSPRVAPPNINITTDRV